MKQKKTQIIDGTDKAEVKNEVNETIEEMSENGFDLIDEDYETEYIKKDSSMHSDMHHSVFLVFVEVNAQ